MEIILFIIALIATSLGSLAGIGGGIIIKPLLDVFHMEVLTVGTLSSLTVLSVALVSSVKHIHAKRFSVKTLHLVIGALSGGLIGNIILLIMSNDPVFLQQVQSILLTFVLVLIMLLTFVKKRLKQGNNDKPVFTIVIGLILGVIASFLGIGGGPINMFVLYVFFGLNAKEAAASSVFIIIFAQITKLFFITTSFDVGYLIYMIPGGIIGGFLGAYYNKLLDEKLITRIFYLTIATMIVINLYNYGLF